MRRFLECLIPVTACNLECSYCYVIQLGRRKNEKAVFRYPPETIAHALSVERLGGVSLISICGSGETLIPPELPEIVSLILKEGHFVNITTNGTLSKRFDELLHQTEGFHSHLHFSFSFHYVELKNRGLIETFFQNIKKVRDAGCSILLQINLSDEYIPYWDEIKSLSLQHVGALPQVALTRTQTPDRFCIRTKLSDEEYVKIGEEMHSPLFDFTCKNFNVKRHEYCYGGLWSSVLNLCTGEMSSCYGSGIVQNIFEHPERPIRWCPIGRHCNKLYCINSSHFLSQGVIPELLPLPSYGELRNREQAGWYTAEMREFLYTQMSSINPRLSIPQKFIYDLEYRFSKALKRGEKFKNHMINSIQYRLSTAFKRKKKT